MKRLAERLLNWILHPEWADDITGDLEEIYTRNLERSRRFAEWKYAGQAFMLIRPSLIRPIKLSNNTYDMFKNYLKISTRSLMRHKLSTAINVFGLAIGLAVFLLLNQYVRFERSFDGFFTTSDYLYRITSTALVNGEAETKDAMATYSAGIELYKAVPEITNFTTTYNYDPGMVFRVGEKTTQENRVISADSNFLEVFPYEVLQGNPKTFLSEPYKLVITESKAQDYFGSPEEAIGQTIEILDEFDKEFVISGVIQDIPANTHYRFDFMISDPSLADREDYEAWNYDNYYAYVLLDPLADPAIVQEKINKEHKRLYEYDEARWDLGKVSDIHLRSDFAFEPDVNGSEKAISFLSYISFFILLIAWVNYINLSTARAMERAKEVGLRKVVGAYKAQLIFQFFTEALVVNLVAAFIALVIAQLVEPVFNQLIGTKVITEIWKDPSFLGKLALFFAIGTVVSGFYPAIVLSRYRPVETLKGSFRNSRSGTVLRKGLVVVQFAASIILVAGTLIIQKQVNYMLGKDLGITTDQVVTFTIPSVYDEETAGRSDQFKEALLTHSAIQDIGRTSNVPGGKADDINSTTTEIRIVGMSEHLAGTTYLQFVDDRFMPAVEMELITGRNFERDRASDSSAFLANEAFVRRFNVETGEALNQQIQFGNQEEHYTLIGIVKDFNRTSLKTDVEPTLYVPALYTSNFVLKASLDGMDEALLHLEQTWDQFYPEMPLDYAFLDDRFASLYMEDQRFGNLFFYFSIFTILIALLGLFGLAAFITIQRTKEVGIRKALGASIFEIILMFIREFALLVLFAALIGVPVVYFAMDSWLNNYAFRIDFPWEMSIAGIIMVGLFAIGTVLYQVFNVARTDPADSLKYE